MSHAICFSSGFGPSTLPGPLPSLRFAFLREPGPLIGHFGGRVAHRWDATAPGKQRPGSALSPRLWAVRLMACDAGGASCGTQGEDFLPAPLGGDLAVAFLDIDADGFAT